MSMILTILAEFIFVASLIILFYKLKPRFGLAPLFVFIGSNQYFQTILFKSNMISVFGVYNISPAATILFSASLFTILLIYIKEGVRSTRNLIFAIILTNLAFSIYSWLVDAQMSVSQGESQLAVLAWDYYYIHARPFIVGTVLLILDTFLIVILYEYFFTKIKWLNLFSRATLALLIILNFDAMLFVTGSFWGNPDLDNIIIGQVIGKSTAAILFGAVLFIYLRYIDADKNSKENTEEKGKEDIFSILTYRRRFEKLKAEKEVSEEYLQKIIAEKTEETINALRRHRILASVQELRIDKSSAAEQANAFLIKVQEAFEVDACTIHLIKNDELYMLSSVGIAEKDKDFELSFNFPFVKRIITNKESLRIDDTRKDPDFTKMFIENGNGFKYISCAGSPLINGELVTGVLKIYSVQAERRFTQLEMEHLHVIAQQVAHSIETAQLFLQNEKHKEVLVKQIIARKKAEESIKESEEKYRTLAEAIPDYIMRYDNEGRHTYMNQAALAISGKTAEQVIGKTHLEAGYDKEQSAFWEEKISNVFKTKEPFEEQFAWESADGLVHLDWRLSPEIDEKGNVVSVLGVSRDITKLKKAEEDIRRSFERFELIGKAANDALWEWNLETNHIWGNEAHQQLYGLTLADPVPEDDIWKKNLHDDDRQQVLESLQETFASDRNIWDMEYRFYTVNKGWINVFGRTYIERNADGKPIRMLGSMMDITERKKQQDVLERSEQNLRQVLTSITDIFYVIDRNYQITLMNKTANELLTKAWGTSVVTGKNILEIIPKEGDEPVQESFEKVFAGESVEYEHRRFAKEIQGWYLVSYHPVISDKGEIIGAYVVTKDITERRKAQEQVIEYNKQLRDLASHLLSIREEERRRIGREIHDDLGQQLTAIKMDVAWIDKKITEDEIPIKGKLKNIIGLLDGSNQSVRRILNELKPSILDEYGLLDAMEWHAEQFTQNTGIQAVISCQEEEIKLDENLATCIFRVFQESLTNVARHSEAKKVIISIAIINEHIIVTIEDDGIGFEFASVQNKGSFGLLGMNERVRAVNGRLNLESEKDKGTSVKITIPLKKIKVN